jgi:ribose/xylose/arabinose/galactoside ABC-type transport system permease subunit
MSITLALIGAVVLFSALNPAFLSAENLSAIGVQSVFLLIIAVGMTFVLTAGAIDLSVGSVLGLSGGVTMLVLSHGLGTVPAVVAGLAVGGIFGLINGLLVTTLRLSDFIVTLATMGVAAGLLQIMAYFRPLRGGETPAFTWLANGKLFGLPFPIVLALAIVAVMAVVLQWSAFGRRVRASGMSPAGAKFAGIDVPRIRLTVFVMSGLLAAVAGVLLASRLASVQPALGRGYELQAIAAAVLGGTSLAGGRGSVIGAAVAALLLAAISAGLQIIRVDPTWYQVVVGISILLAVAFHGWAERFVDRNISGGGTLTPEPGNVAETVVAVDPGASSAPRSNAPRTASGFK